jgi:plasmid stability protein
MAQLTIRLDDDLARALKEHAASSGRSLNSWAVAVLAAAVDPDLAGSEAERTRERLLRAGLLQVPEGSPAATPPDPRRVAAARRKAGRGTPLSELVADARD